MVCSFHHRTLPRRAAMTTCWTSPQIYHPWFTKPSTKRKLSPYGDDTPYTRPPSPSSKRQRRKYESLEHNFADMTLEYTPPNPPPVFAHSQQPSSQFGLPPRASLPFITSASTPGAVPLEQPIQDVLMSISTWYEPEKDRASRLDRIHSVVLMTVFRQESWSPR